MKKSEKELASDFEMGFYEGVLNNTPDHIDALMSLAELYTQKGLYDKGLALDLRLAKLCPQDSGVFYNLACSQALVGKKKEAVATLRKALKLGYCDFKHLRKDPDLKSLYSDPDFQSLIGAEQG